MVEPPVVVISGGLGFTVAGGYALAWPGQSGAPGLRVVLPNAVQSCRGLDASVLSAATAALVIDVVASGGSGVVTGEYGINQLIDGTAEAHVLQRTTAGDEVTDDAVQGLVTLTSLASARAAGLLSLTLQALDGGSQSTLSGTFDVPACP